MCGFVGIANSNTQGSGANNRESWPLSDARTLTVNEFTINHMIVHVSNEFHTLFRYVIYQVEIEASCECLDILPCDRKPNSQFGAGFERITTSNSATSRK